SGRYVLHDGRQPRQLGRQPLLGLHAALVHQGEGAFRVFFVRRCQRPERSALEHPLEPDVSSDSLIDEMKTVIKLIIAAVLVNAAYRGGSVFLKYYQFKDETQQMILFGQAET